ncbi:MAG: hypothetical protein R2851_12255 [Caldilineaceae bacterium]
MISQPDRTAAAVVARRLQDSALDLDLPHPPALTLLDRDDWLAHP